MLNTRTITRRILGLSTSIAMGVCAAVVVHLFSWSDLETWQERARLTRTVAIATSRLAESEDVDGITRYLEEVAEQHPELESITIWGTDGAILTRVINSRQQLSADVEEPVEPTPGKLKNDTESNASTAENSLPLVTNDTLWGQIQLKYSPISATILGLRIAESTRRGLTVCAVVAVGLLALLMWRLLVAPQPSQSVPPHLRKTLDTLAEGLVILNDEGRVMLSNMAFTTLLTLDKHQVKGTKLSDLNWESGGAKVPERELPWSRCLASKQPVVSATLELNPAEESNSEIEHEFVVHETITLLINVTPLGPEDGVDNGVIVSFDDITPLEAKKHQLAEMLHAVRESTDEIKRQNEELERLATHDPLTGCINRRRLFELFETEWKSATRHDLPLSCAMVDVDHFKAVNDEHGHVVGDKVLARVATALKDAARDTDVVARYGGEEFCVLLTHTDINHAYAAADRFRSAIANVELAGTAVTASVGVSEISFGAADPQLLLDQADRALYAAKRLGRDRVIRFDEIPTDLDLQLPAQRSTAPLEGSAAQNIPFHAVTALISALAYRDQDTAAHCRRVADLAVATAEGIMGVTDCYTLEIAALLHDLGKIGVPDNILLKPGRLTDNEWAIMRRHDRIGVEIVRASFAFQPLTEIVSRYRTPYSVGGTDLPIGSRILAIVDAYDSMVGDRPYRKGRTREEAFNELHKCRGHQFDPELVARFIDTVRNGAATQEEPITVGKETALSIGLQIEHLAAALDDRDMDRLGALAARLRTVAERFGVKELADQAEGLEQAVDSEGDLISVLQSANDLLRLCRSTQKSYIDQDANELLDGLDIAHNISASENSPKP